MQKDVQVALVEGSEDSGGSESRYRASGGVRPGGYVRVNICAGQVAALGAKLALSRARASGSGLASSVSWWRNAVMYEVYLRSFADGDGDGIGDIPGLRSRVPYLRDLGVDGILITPWYPSPMKDGGYDVSSYVGIEPLFGTLADARELIDDAHRNDLKVVVDFVANHTSDQHPWFKRALAAAPGSGRARYHFRDGKGPGGSDPPNDWISAFGGSAWTQIIEPDGIPGQWYLHLFSPAQPDLNWDNLEVRGDFESILRFWFDFGLD
jgi:alpha-glucosidase